MHAYLYPRIHAYQRTHTCIHTLLHACFILLEKLPAGLLFVGSETESTSKQKHIFCMQKLVWHRLTRICCPYYSWWPTLVRGRRSRVTGSAEVARNPRIDDPLDASSVHGACGFWGGLAAVLFDWGHSENHFHGSNGWNCKDWRLVLSLCSNSRVWFWICSPQHF